MKNIEEKEKLICPNCLGHLKVYKYGKYYDCDICMGQKYVTKDEYNNFINNLIF